MATVLFPPAGVAVLLDTDDGFTFPPLEELFLSQVGADLPGDGPPPVRLRFLLTARDGVQTSRAPTIRFDPALGGIRVGPARLRVAGPGEVVAEVPTRRSREVPPQLRRALFFVALQEGLALAGWSLLHAAAVEVEGRCWLLVGESGSGKSTLAMVAAALSGRIVSDDTVLLGGLAGEEVVVAAFRRDVVLREAGERVAPAGVRAALRPALLGGRQRAVLERGRAPALFVDRASPKGILLTKVDRRRRRSRRRRALPAEVLAALIAAGTPLFFSARMPALQQRLLPPLVALASRCPAYHVSLATDLLKDPVAVGKAIFSWSPPETAGPMP